MAAQASELTLVSYYDSERTLKVAVDEAMECVVDFPGPDGRLVAQVDKLRYRELCRNIRSRQLQDRLVTLLPEHGLSRITLSYFATPVGLTFDICLKNRWGMTVPLTWQELMRLPGVLAQQVVRAQPSFGL